jgi:hypothetical protein
MRLYSNNPIIRLKADVKSSAAPNGSKYLGHVCSVYITPALLPQPQRGPFPWLNAFRQSEAALVREVTRDPLFSFHEISVIAIRGT